MKHLSWLWAHRLAFAVILATLVAVELVRRMVGDNLIAPVLNLIPVASAVFFRSSPKDKP